MRLISAISFTISLSLGLALSTTTGATPWHSSNKLQQIVMNRRHRHSSISQRQETQTECNETNTKNATSSFRFLTNDTAKFQVTSLPEVPFDLGELYAGLIPINTSEPDRSLFFIFQPTINTPVDEITVFLNGGPGCASTTAFLQENGRWLWQPGTFAPTLNPYSWVNETNMLWVDQPAGTGYSVGSQPRVDNEVDLAHEFAGFFANFQRVFGIKRFKIYLTGESYAGRYVSYIADEMLKKNDSARFDVRGILLYDPSIGNYIYTSHQVPIVPFAQRNNNLLGLNASFLASMATAHAQCGYSSLLATYLQYPPPGHQAPGPFPPTSLPPSCDLWSAITAAATAVNPCYDVYAINQACPLLSDPLALYAGLAAPPYPGYTPYFNRTDVKLALHVPPSLPWSECVIPTAYNPSGSVFAPPPSPSPSAGPEGGDGDTSPDPIQGPLPRVIEATNRVLIANGDYDGLLLSDGILLAIQNMSWAGQLGFQSRPFDGAPGQNETKGSGYVVVDLPDLMYEGVYAENGLAQGYGEGEPQGVVGTKHLERGLMWARTFRAGHMHPAGESRASLRHLRWVLGRIDTL